MRLVILGFEYNWYLGMYCAGTVNGVNIVGLALQNPSIPGLALPPPGMDTPFDTRGNLTFHTRRTNRQNNIISA